MFERRIPFYEWEAAFRASEVAKRPTEELVRLKKHKLKDKNQTAALYNCFSSLGTSIMKYHCNLLSRHLSFYAEHCDYIGVAAELKVFASKYRNIFFFKDFKALSKEERARLTGETATCIRDFFRPIVKALKDNEITDAVYECEKCLTDLNRYEQL